MFPYLEIRSIRTPVLIAMLATLSLAGTPLETAAQTTRKAATFRQRLVAGLQVRRPSEFAFIDAVVDTVERGELPQRLVDRFFFWARNRPAKSVATSRPIIYFQQGLMIQAKQLKINIASTPAPSTP